MYNAIEIPDSDDDMSEPTLDLPKSVSSIAEINEHTPEKQRKTSISTAAPEAVTATTPGSASYETTGSVPPKTKNNISSSSNQMQTKNQGRHRSRKTQHTVRNALENEIQFETIPLDDETSAAQEQLVKENEKLNVVIGNLINTDEMQTVVQRIANERVRCNFLLTTYHVSKSKSDVYILKNNSFINFVSCLTCILH